MNRYHFQRGFVLCIVLLLLALFSITVMIQYEELWPAQQILSLQQEKILMAQKAYRILRDFSESPEQFPFASTCKRPLTFEKNNLNSGEFWRQNKICHDLKKHLDYFFSDIAVKHCWKIQGFSESGVVVTLMSLRAYSVTKGIAQVYQGSFVIPLIGKTHCQNAIIEVSSGLLSWREIF